MSSTGRSSEVLIDVVLWAAALVCAGLTLWWSVGSLPPEGRLFEGVDKLQHGLAYLVTSLLLFLAAVWRPGRGGGPFARGGVWVVAALIAAGAGIECSNRSSGATPSWGIGWPKSLRSDCRGAPLPRCVHGRGGGGGPPSGGRPHPRHDAPRGP